MTPLEALTHLTAHLPANPTLDTPTDTRHRRALQVLAGVVERPDVYPVTWHDYDTGERRNTWSRNPLTQEIEPDPQGGPLYTTEAPPEPG